MRLLAVTAILVISAVISLVAGIRSRLRVRKMLAEDVGAGLECAIDRLQVKRFFGETTAVSSGTRSPASSRKPATRSNPRGKRFEIGK